MKKVLFATDLDKTIISKDAAPEGSRNIVVSTTHWGKSYITNTNLQKLKELAEYADIVPITTRSKNSYNTVSLCIPIKYAMIENGGILIVDNKIDNNWISESINLIDKDKEFFDIGTDLFKGMGYQQKSPSTFVLDYINPDTNKQANEECFTTANEVLGGTFDIYKGGNHGIFATYKKLNKGAAIKRFLERYGYEKIIIAGDSQTDWSMVSMFDGISLSDSPAKYKFPKEVHEQNSHLFSSFILDTALKISKEVYA